jgi:hypothetical protein
VDVPELLQHATLSVPTIATTEAGLTVLDAREYLDHNEWEIALDILTELGDDHPATVEWWDLLIDAAQQMRLEHSTAWCRWRRRETIHGIIRADLQLLASEDGGRRTPIPGRGKTRPLWDLGQLTAAGEPDFRIAVIWVEYAPGAVAAATPRRRHHHARGQAGRRNRDDRRGHTARRGRPRLQWLVSRQVQSGSNREVLVDRLHQGGPSPPQPDPLGPRGEDGEEADQVTLHAHQQRGQRSTWHVDMDSGPAAVMTVRAAVLPHPQVVADNLDLRARVMA